MVNQKLAWNRNDHCHILGIIFILFSGAASWESMIKNHKAWDALIWLGGLLTLATSLKDLGFISWFTSSFKTC